MSQGSHFVSLGSGTAIIGYVILSDGATIAIAQSDALMGYVTLSGSTVALGQSDALIGYVTLSGSVVDVSSVPIAKTSDHYLLVQHAGVNPIPVSVEVEEPLPTGNNRIGFVTQSGSTIQLATSDALIGYVTLSASTVGLEVGTGHIGFVTLSDSTLKLSTTDSLIGHVTLSASTVGITSIPLAVDASDNLTVNNKGWNGVSWQTIISDSATNAQVHLDWDHHQVHQGKSFTYARWTDLAADNTTHTLIRTPSGASLTHIHYKAATEDECILRIYEDPQVLTASIGTLMSTYNRKRNSTTTAGTLVYAGTLVDTGSHGTLVESTRTGSNKDFGGEAAGVEELILKNSADYLFQIISKNNSSSQWVANQFNFYEHEAIS